jgi:Na+-driven multidrug efflux pump
VTTQGFLSAIEKPMLATAMSVATALVFPVIILGALWDLGLDGIWANFIGVNILAAILGIFLLLHVRKEMRKKKAKVAAPEDA